MTGLRFFLLVARRSFNAHESRFRLALLRVLFPSISTVWRITILMSERHLWLSPRHTNTITMIGRDQVQKSISYTLHDINIQAFYSSLCSSCMRTKSA